MRLKPYIVMLIAVALLTTGCGLKGDLYLAPEQSDSAPAATSPNPDEKDQNDAGADS
ncbi:MAG: hypothetical protein Tsb002_37770 [Wenzhouxiangellaceae bacterium]